MAFSLPLLLLHLRVSVVIPRRHPVNGYIVAIAQVFTNFAEYREGEWG